MVTAQLVWFIAGAWLLLSCVVGLVLGLVVRGREAMEAPGRRYSVIGVDELQATFHHRG